MPASKLNTTKTHAQKATTALFMGVAAATLYAPMANAETGEGNWYFFGDSSIGQGNFSAIVGERGEDFTPYSSNNGFERDSNGLIWAELMGRDVDIVLDPDQNSSNLNFAISGAHMTRGGDLVPFGVETGVRVQTEEFAALVDGGILDIENDDVAFMIAGGNDFLDRLDAGEDADLISAEVANAAAENVAELANAGIRTIVISEIQPLQYSPMFAGDDAAKSSLDELMDDANEEMFDTIAGTTLPSDLNLVTMKYENFLSYMTSNATALGFTQTDVVCYNGDADTLCSTDVDEQNRYVFIDELHFSEGGHRLAAQWWKSTLNAASGEASRQVARIGDVAQFELENILGRVGAGRPDTEKSFSVYGDFFMGTPLLAHEDIRSLVETDYKGVVIGGEGFLTETVFAGAAFTLTESDVDTLAGGRYKSGSKGLHGYIGIKPDWYDVRVGAAYGWLDIDDIFRPAGVSLLSASGETDGNYWDTYIEVGGESNFMGINIDGDVSFHASEISVDGFIESGAQGLALSYEKQTRKSRRIEAGLKIQPMSWHVRERFSVSPVADFNYRRELTDGSYTLTSQLIDNTANSAVFMTDGVASDRLNAAFGFDFEFDDSWKFGARYEKTWADDVSGAEGVSVVLRKEF